MFANLYPTHQFLSKHSKTRRIGTVHEWQRNIFALFVFFTLHSDWLVYANFGEVNSHSRKKSRFKFCIISTVPDAHCVKNRHTFSSLKSIVWYISINYLTTNEPYQIKIQKFQKIRKTYSPDPESGSGIPEIWDKFFS